MASTLKLIATTPEMRDLLVGALEKHGIAYCSQGEMIVIESGSDAAGEDDHAPEQVIALLRSILSAPVRDAVSVVDELNFPNEFPVTTRLEAWWSLFETSWFEKAVTDDAFSIWFQPIVDTAARRTIGRECLLRVTKGHRREGAEIMAAAARRDLRGFDSYARQLALHTIAAEQPEASLCFINFIPSTIQRPTHCMQDTLHALKETGMSPGNFVFEAVESTRNPDVDHLHRIGDFLREQGIGFGLDDVTASADALRLVCDLRPDYIKLDKHLIHRMDQPREAAAVWRLVEVAQGLGVGVIAKNVDRVSIMESLWDAEVHCMQGYLFGSPAPGMAGTSLDLKHLARAIQPSPDASGFEPAFVPETVGLALA